LRSATNDLGAFEAGLRTMPGLSDMIYPVVRTDRSFMLSAIVFAVACITALYPAIHAAVLEPVEAIRGLMGGRGVSARGAAASPGWPVFILIAARNILRNRRRTAIMIGGTAFGILAFVFLFGFFDGFFEQMVENSTRYLTGHVQLERAGFRKDLAPELALESPRCSPAARAPNAAACSSAGAGQQRASRKASSSDRPDPRADVTSILRRGGRALERASRDHDRPQIGRSCVARRKNGGDGPKSSGANWISAYRVGEIFRRQRLHRVRVRHAPAAHRCRLGTRVSTANMPRGPRGAGPDMEELRRLAAAPGLAFAPWQELLPQLEEMVRFNRVVSDIILAVFLLVVATAIMNTVFMAVAERTREFGVMMALGTPPGAIRRMVVYETVVLMTLASLLGYGIGIALVEYSGRQGIDLSGFFRGYSAIPGLTGIVYPKLFLETIVAPGVALLIASVLVSLYPAAKAARLDPVSAIRHV
jgi:ABC-type lipoprotein release transport system permease subunit